MRQIMKKILPMTLGALLIFSITGCSSKPEVIESQEQKVAETQEILETESSTQENPESEETNTRIVSTPMGEIEIPAVPERIAAFGNTGDLVSIGKLPIAGDFEARLFDGLLDDNYTYLTLDDYEGIMALEPDMIILSSEPEQEVYKKLSGIAPVVVIDSYSLTLSQRILFTGECIGMEEEAKKAMTDYETSAKQYREELAAAGMAGKSVSIMEGVYLFGEKYGRGADIIYNYLGFTAPEKLQKVFDQGEFYLEVSMEVLNEYCGDYILNVVWDGSDDLSQNEVWNSIPAVKNNHLIELDFTDYFSRDLYTSSKQMKLLKESFLALE